MDEDEDEDEHVQDENEDKDVEETRTRSRQGLVLDWGQCSWNSSAMPPERAERRASRGKLACIAALVDHPLRRTFEPRL